MAQVLSPVTTTSPFDRTVAKIVRGMPTSDGAGVKLTRLIGTPALRNVDPFLMLDEFRSDDPKDYLAGFPDHPHRGFETITYMIAGRFRHRDSKGHEGLLGAGSAQWVTAGSGLVHSEMPEQEEGLVQGFQLWLNLPRAEKMREPSYRDIQPEDIPQLALGGGATARVLAGTLGGATGPIGDRTTAPLFFDVELAANGTADLTLPPDHAVFVYPFAGTVAVGPSEREKELARGELGVLGAGGGVRLRSKTGARVLVIGGKPLREPVVQYGPFVMSSVEEIEQAIRDYQAGRF